MATVMESPMRLIKKRNISVELYQLGGLSNQKFNAHSINSFLLTISTVRFGNRGELIAIPYTTELYKNYKIK